MESNKCVLRSHCIVNQDFLTPSHIGTSVQGQLVADLVPRSHLQKSKLTSSKPKLHVIAESDAFSVVKCSLGRR